MVAKNSSVSVIKFDAVKIKTSESLEVIIGQGNFTVKTIDDLYACVFQSSKDVKFGVAMNEAKPRLTRVAGNDGELKKLAGDAALRIGAGHVFVIYLRNAFPIHVMNSVKSHPCIACIFAATSNPCEVIVANTALGRAVVGVVDGTSANAIENETQKKERRELVKKFGYVPE